MSRPGEAQDWRRRAEEALGPEEAREPEGVDLRRLLHELRVHQIELEMQNQALEEARLEAEAGWERYQELYDFAPAGFFSVERRGTILEMNLAGARLLGIDRSQATHQPLARFLEPRDRPVFEAFLQRALGNQGAPPCEVALARVGPRSGMRVRLEGATSADGKVLQVAALEMPDRDAPDRDGTAPPAPDPRLLSQLGAAASGRLALNHILAQELRPSLVHLEGLSLALGAGPGSGPSGLAEGLQAVLSRLRQAMASLEGLGTES